MFIGTIRPVETRTIEVQGYSLADVQAQLAEQIPAGWELTDIPTTMIKGTPLIGGTATIARRDGARTIEADDMGALRAKVPDGWRLLAVRSL